MKVKGDVTRNRQVIHQSWLLMSPNQHWCHAVRAAIANISGQW
jgi:hypothetical protein